MDEQFLKDLGLDESSISDLWEKFITGATTYGFDVLSAIIVLIIGWWIAARVQKLVERGLSRIKNADPTLTGFLSMMVRYAILAVVIMAVLERFGVETTSLVAVIGAAGLAIGLALQGTLSNVAAGVMLLIFRPFRVGHYVEAGGHGGTVKRLGLFTTDLDTPDNVRVVVPNADIWGAPIKNYASNRKRRLDIGCGIGYGDDIDKAMKVMREIASKDERILDDPAVNVFVDSLGDSSVNLILRVFVPTSDYWDARWDLTKAVKQGFDKAGIEIPFPQRSIHMVTPVDVKETKPKKKTTKKAS